MKRLAPFAESRQLSANEVAEQGTPKLSPALEDWLARVPNKTDRSRERRLLLTPELRLKRLAGLEYDSECEMLICDSDHELLAILRAEEGPLHFPPVAPVVPWESSSSVQAPRRSSPSPADTATELDRPPATTPQAPEERDPDPIGNEPTQLGTPTLEGTTGYYRFILRLPLIYLREVAPHALRPLLYFMYRDRLARGRGTKRGHRKFSAAYVAIARGTGRSVKSARRAVEHLRAMGIIARVSRGSLGRSTVYRLRPMPVELREKEERLEWHGKHVQEIPLPLIAAWTGAAPRGLSRRPDKGPLSARVKARRSSPTDARRLLSDPAFKVLLVHRRYARLVDSDCHALSLARIGKESGLHPDTVRRANWELLDAGLLEQRSRGGGREESCWRVCRMPRAFWEIGKDYARRRPGPSLMEELLTTVDLVLDLPKGEGQATVTCAARCPDVPGWCASCEWDADSGRNLLIWQAPDWCGRRISCTLRAVRAGRSLGRATVEFVPSADETVRVEVGELQPEEAADEPRSSRRDYSPKYGE